MLFLTNSWSILIKVVDGIVLITDGRFHGLIHGNQQLRFVKDQIIGKFYSTKMLVDGKPISFSLNWHGYTLASVVADFKRRIGLK